jgi:hypothetical protein
MEWYKHKTNACSDAKIKKLLIRHGAEGYAVYFHCLELIAGDISKTKVTFELEHDAEIIADTLRIKGEGSISPVDKVGNIMREIVKLGLFEENDGLVTCFKLAHQLSQSMTSNKTMRALIANIKQEDHDPIMTPSQPDLDAVMREEKRRDKIRRDKSNKESKKKSSAKRFTPPTIEEVKKYCWERKNVVDFQRWHDHYTSNGWMVGKNKMKDWKAAVRTWERNTPHQTQQSTKIHNQENVTSSFDFSAQDGF